MKSSVFLQVFSDISTYPHVFTEYFLHTFACSAIENTILFMWQYNIILTKNTLGVKKSCGQELKKGQDKKEVKSKWAAKACVVLLLIKIKF